MCTMYIAALLVPRPVQSWHPETACLADRQMKEPVCLPSSTLEGLTGSPDEIGHT